MARRRDVRSAVIGMVLGDGHLEKPVGPKGHSRFSSASVSEEYARYKSEILSAITSVRVWRDGLIWRVRTNRHPLFTDLRRRFYIEGRKTVDRHLVLSLDECGLACWYFDDGDLHKQDLKVNIATDNFSEPECETLVEGLRDRFSLRWSITHAWRRVRKYCRLRLKASDRETFFRLIQDAAQAVPSMSYKLPTAEGAERIRYNATRLNGPSKELETVLPWNTLRQMYVEDGLSIWAIAQRTGVNSGTILGKLRRMAVPVRNAGKYAPRRYDLTPMATSGAAGNAQPSR